MVGTRFVWGGGRSVFWEGNYHFVCQDEDPEPPGRSRDAEQRPEEESDYERHGEKVGPDNMVDDDQEEAENLRVGDDGIKEGVEEPQGAYHGPFKLGGARCGSYRGDLFLPFSAEREGTEVR